MKIDNTSPRSIVTISRRIRYSLYYLRLFAIDDTPHYLHRTEKQFTYLLKRKAGNKKEWKT